MKYNVMCSKKEFRSKSLKMNQELNVGKELELP